MEHFQPPHRVVWEGYPNLLYGNQRNEPIPDDTDSRQLMVTYLFPMNVVDYYFRKEAGFWHVFKRVQKNYSQDDLKAFAAESFEGFVLRFISDTSFRLKRIKWPLKDTDYPVGYEQGTVSYRKKGNSNFNKPWEKTALMTVYEQARKSDDERDTMYFRSLSEGGVCYGWVFKKISNHWTLIETWDASN